MTVGVRQGRVWKFGNDINTDLMLPGSVVYGTEEEQTRMVFSANRPNWVHDVRPGDLIVGGTNYGTGSGRPAARSLVNHRVGGLIAESINGLFFRSCVSYGLLALECPGITGILEDGDIAEISLDSFTVRNTTSGKTLQAVPVPPRLLEMMCGGGVFPFLEANGLVSPLLGKAGSSPY